MQEDYVFRYPLQVEGKGQPVYQDPLLEMVRSLLESLLNVVILVQGDREVKVDGFKLLRDRKTTYPIFPSHVPHGQGTGEADVISPGGSR